jgi:hypothetical protein
MISHFKQSLYKWFGCGMKKKDWNIFILVHKKKKKKKMRLWTGIFSTLRFHENMGFAVDYCIYRPVNDCLTKEQIFMWQIHILISSLHVITGQSN